jgi:hypothetical protein
MLKAVPIQQAIDKANASAPAPPAPEEKKEKPADPSKLKAGPLNVPLNAGQNYGPAADPLKGGPVPAAIDTKPPSGTVSPPGDATTTAPAIQVPPPSAVPLRSGEIPGAAIPARRSDDTAPTRRTDNAASPRFSEPGGRAAPPATVRHTDPGDEMVSVSLCADSHKRATQWCDATYERRMKRREIPSRCRTHKPPPGEGEG